MHVGYGSLGILLVHIEDVCRTTVGIVCGGGLLDSRLVYGVEAWRHGGMGGGTKAGLGFG